MKTMYKKRWLGFVVALLLANTGCAQSDDAIEGLAEVLPQMIDIDGGTFMMGDMAEEGDANELPVHEVTVGDFKIAATEVTYSLFDLFAESTGHRMPSDEGWGRGQLPVTNVSWNDAQALIAWLNEQTGRSFRLPSEAEWEYAARAGTSTPFANGNTITREYGNYGPTDCCAKGSGVAGRDQFVNTAPVGSFEPNQWGLYDTVGNVWEWTQDCWNDNYDGAPSDGNAWTQGDCTRAPLKGGSWTHYSRNLRHANRNDNGRDHFANGYGIRLAEDAE